MPNRPISSIVAKQTVVSASKNTSVLEAATLMEQRKVSAIMVVENDKLVGLFTERDALYRVLAKGVDPAKTTLADVMTSNLSTIAPSRPLGHALHMMYDYGFRHVPVVDENGKPLGMVSARDALGMDMVQFEKELRQRDDLTELMG